MDDVSLGQKKFGEVGAVLPGHASDDKSCRVQVLAVPTTRAVA
jgi:hypothetical protein